MLLSVLALSPGSTDAQDSDAFIERLARYLADTNCSCVAWSGVRQRSSVSLVGDSLTVHADNGAYLVGERLARYGVKYTLSWSRVRAEAPDVETGNAILSQLPILRECTSDQMRPASSEPRIRRDSMARLAIAPNAVIDFYPVVFAEGRGESESTYDAFVEFVDATPEILEQLKPPPMKRRGPPRKRVPEDERPVQTRLTCLAGRFPDAGFVQDLVSKSYFDVTAAASAERHGSFDPSIHIFVRPALRPQDVADVVIDGEWVGVSAEFEV